MNSVEWEFLIKRSMLMSPITINVLSFDLVVDSSSRSHVQNSVPEYLFSQILVTTKIVLNEERTSTNSFSRCVFQKFSKFEFIIDVKIYSSSFIPIHVASNHFVIVLPPENMCHFVRFKLSFNQTYNSRFHCFGQGQRL